MRMITLVLAGLCMATSAARAGDSYSIDNEQGKHLDIVMPGGKPVLRYMYERDTSTKARTFDTAKIFAHVIAPNGETTLTKGAGGKFPHHRGIFIGWNRLKHNGKSHDLWHVRNTEQAHQEFVETRAGKEGAKIVSRIDWIGTEGEPVLKEARTYEIVDQDGAYAVIDFVSELTAHDGDVELNGDPEHAGVQFRPSQQVAENKSATYTFHAEGVDPKKQTDLPWVANSFKVDGEWWTVQHMNHPQNPEGARWSAYRDYGRFGPFPAVTIPNGETLTIRHRFRVMKGEAPERDSLQQAFEDYTSQ